MKNHGGIFCQDGYSYIRNNCDSNDGQRRWELEPTELVVTIMISELASIPMQETGVPLISGNTDIDHIGA